MATDRYSDNHSIVVKGGSGNLTINADLVVDGNLDVSGDALNIAGNVSIDGTLNVSNDVILSSDLSVTQGITANTIESTQIRSNSIQSSSTLTRKIWIPATFFSWYGVGNRQIGSSGIANYGDDGESGSALYFSSNSVVAGTSDVAELSVLLNQFLTKHDLITKIEIIGAANGANNVIHYTLEVDSITGSSTRTTYQVLLDSDSVGVTRTLDNKTLYYKSTSSVNFVHNIYPSIDLPTALIFNSRAYCFKIHLDNVTYTPLGTSEIEGIVLTIETTSPF